MGGPLGEVGHDAVFFVGVHFAVQDAEGEVWCLVGEFLGDVVDGPGGGCFVAVGGLVGVNFGGNDECLVPCGGFFTDFLPHTLIMVRVRASVNNMGLDRLPTGWQAGERNNIKVTVNRHSNSARDWCCRHGNRVRLRCKLIEGISLGYSEAVLLIDDDGRKITPGDTLREERVRADNDSGLARLDELPNVSCVFRVGRAREKLHCHRRRHSLLERFIMLLSKNFRRSDERGREPIMNSLQKRISSNSSFTCTNITQQQSIERAPLSLSTIYTVNSRKLPISEGIRQRGRVFINDPAASFCEWVRSLCVGVVAFLGECELHGECFVVGEAGLRGVLLGLGGGVVDVLLSLV